MLEVGTGFNGEMTGRENIYMGGDNILHAHKEYSMEDYSVKEQQLFQILSTDLNHNDCQYDIGEPIEVDFTCLSKQHLSNVSFRFQIVAKDGIRVGSSFTGGEFEICENEQTHVLVEIPTNELISGQYLIEVSISISNQLGANNYINTLKNSFFVEIKPSVINWHPNWGHTHLADAKVKLTKKI